MKRRNNPRFSFFIIHLLLLAIGIFYGLTLREGHIWAGDFSMYIRHAQNIAEGRPYDDTSYIYNPSIPSIGPPTYPPVFPLLLAPVYSLFGLNLTAMKLANIGCFLIALELLYHLFTPILDFKSAVTVIGMIGLNPFFWNFKDNILSDIPFLVFVLFFLLTVREAHQRAHSSRSQYVWGIMIGSVLYCAYGTRSIGIILFPVLLAYHMLTALKMRRLLVSATGILSILVVGQMYFLHNESGYIVQMNITPAILLTNIMDYSRAMAKIWENGYSKFFRNGLFFFLTALAGVGFVKRFRTSPSLFEIFCLLYMVPVLVWPSYQGTRFLIPIIPFFMFYAMIGLGTDLTGRLKPYSMILTVFLIIGISVSYSGKYTTEQYGTFKEGIAKKETRELFEYITTHTRKDEILIFMRPRVLALFTKRKTSAYHQPDDNTELWQYFQKINVRYLITDPLQEHFWKNFLAMYARHLVLIYQNHDFKMYDMKYAQKEPSS